MLKGLITFTVGAAIGSAVSSYIVYIKMKKQFDKDLSEAIASEKAFVEELRNKQEAEDMTETLKYVSKKESEIVKGFAGGSGVRSGDKRKGATDYTSFYYQKGSGVSASEAVHPDEEDDEDNEDLNELNASLAAKEATEKRNSKSKPFIIGPEEYDDEEYEHHDKVALLYFNEDDTLATEEMDILIDKEALLGDCLKTSGFDHNDEEVLYVRNLRRGSDYEIDKQFAAYHDSVD